MVSDADGKQYPWYGSKTEVQTLEGPTVQPTHVTIHMNDNFFPQVCRLIIIIIIIMITIVSLIKITDKLRLHKK